MGGGELHLESSRQPEHRKDSFWWRLNSKEDHLSDLKVESAMICSLEIEHHGKSPQMINFTWIMQTRVSSISTHFSCIFILYELKLLNKGRLLIQSLVCRTKVQMYSSGVNLEMFPSTVAAGAAGLLLVRLDSSYLLLLLLLLPQGRVQEAELITKQLLVIKTIFSLSKDVFGRGFGANKGCGCSDCWICA